MATVSSYTSRPRAVSPIIREMTRPITDILGGAKLEPLDDTIHKPSRSPSLSLPSLPNFPLLPKRHSTRPTAPISPALPSSRHSSPPSHDQLLQMMQPFLQPIHALLPGGRLSPNLGPIVGDKRPKLPVENNSQSASATNKRRRIDDTAPVKLTRPLLMSSPAPLDASIEKKTVQGNMKPRLTSVPVSQPSTNASTRKVLVKNDGPSSCTANCVKKDVEGEKVAASKRKRGVADDVHSHTEKRRKSDTPVVQSSVGRKGPALRSVRDRKEDGRIARMEPDGVGEASAHVSVKDNKAAEDRRKVPEKAEDVSEVHRYNSEEGKNIPTKKRNGVLGKTADVRETRSDVALKHPDVREKREAVSKHRRGVDEKHEDTERRKNFGPKPKDDRERPNDGTDLPGPGHERDFSSMSSKRQMKEKDPPKRFLVNLKSKPIPGSRLLPKARSESARSESEHPKREQDQDAKRSRDRICDQDRNRERDRGRKQRERSDLRGERGHDQGRRQESDRDRGHPEHDHDYSRDSTRDRDVDRDRDTYRGRNRGRERDGDGIRDSYRDSVRDYDRERDGDRGRDRGRRSRDWERSRDVEERDRERIRMGSDRERDQECGSKRSRSETDGDSGGSAHRKERGRYKEGEGNRGKSGPGRDANRERGNKIQIPTSVPSSGQGSSGSRGSQREGNRAFGPESSVLTSESRLQGGNENLASVRAKLNDFKSLWAEAKSKCETHLEKKEYDAYEEATKKAFRLYFDWSIVKETELRLSERSMPLGERLAKTRDIIHHYRYLTRVFANQHSKELEALKRKKAVAYLTRGVNKAYLRLFGLHRLWQRGQRTREGDAAKFIGDVVNSRNEGVTDEKGVEEIPTDKLVALRDMADGYCNMVQLLESVVLDDGEGPEEAGNECVMQ